MFDFKLFSKRASFLLQELVILDIGDYLLNPFHTDWLINAYVQGRRNWGE